MNNENGKEKLATIETKDENFKEHILSNRAILDVRSKGEFNKGHIPNAINVPILNDEDRHLVGIRHKNNGNEAAIKLGHELVSGEKKERILNRWKEVIDENPDIVLMCARGGSRSQISQEWIKEYLGIELKRFDKGYKTFRHYLMNALLPENINAPSLIISGNTGSGKTVLIKKLDTAIDLEGLANHRGSAFGGRINEQPSQANFENLLAVEMIKLQEKKPSFIAFESESKGIGKVQIPNQFFEYMHSAPYVYLDSTMSERVEFTYDDYVTKDLNDYISTYGNTDGNKLWADNLRNKIQKIERKLGADRLKICLNYFDEANESGDLSIHKNWIEFLLTNYYDPMYEHHRNKWCDKTVFSGNMKEVEEYLSSRDK